MKITREEAVRILAEMQQRAIEKRKQPLENCERIQKSLGDAELCGSDELHVEKIQRERDAFEFYKKQLDNLDAEIAALGLAIDLLK